MECCLKQGELVKLDGGSGGMTVRCIHGTVWLTCGDGRDYLLSAGRSYKLPASAAAVVEALDPAEVFLSKPAVAGGMPALSLLRPAS